MTYRATEKNIKQYYYEKINYTSDYVGTHEYGVTGRANGYRFCE